MKNDNETRNDTLPQTGEIPAITPETTLNSGNETDNLDLNKVDINDSIKSNDLSKTAANNNAQNSNKTKLIASIIIAIIVVVCLICLITYNMRQPGSLQGFFKGDFKKSELSDVSLFPAKTVEEVESGKKINKVKEGDPIIVRFTFSQPKTDEAVDYTYELSNSKGENIRRGSVTVSKSDNTEIKRYIALVSSDRSKIAAGEYKVKLIGPDQKVISQSTFNVTN